MTESFFINGLVLLGCIGWLGWRGYERGVIRTLQRAISIIAAYGACYVALVPVAGWIQVQWSWPLVPAYLASAFVCFFGAAIVVEYLVRMLADQVESRGVEPAQIPGALLGCALGAVLGVITVWLGGVLLDAYSLQGRTRVQTEGQDPVRRLAGQLVAGAIEFSLSPRLEQGSLVPALTSQLLSNPLQLTQQVVQVSQSEPMRALFSDLQAQQLMLGHQTEALQHHPRFVELMALPEAREILMLLGEKTSAGQDLDQQEKVARLLADMYQKVSRVQHDPRFLALAEKPEFKRLAQNPSPVEMLANPALSELAAIIFDPSPSADPVPGNFQRLEPLQWEAPESAAPAVMSTDVEIAEPEGIVMYRWTDKNGRKHYSETRPEEDYEVEVVRLSP